MGPAPGALVAAATAEWNHWGNATWNRVTGHRSSGYHIDDEHPYGQYVVDNYVRTTKGGGPVAWPDAVLIGNDDYAWSAVFISYLMRTAGFSPSQFPVSESHSRYIRWSIAQRKANNAAASYWGYRIDEPQAVPEVGDLIGYPRGENLNATKALAYFNRTTSYPSHTDLVVAKREGEIDVIGGNVLDSVTKKTLKLKPSGHVADTGNFWFVVMKKR